MFKRLALISLVSTFHLSQPLAMQSQNVHAFTGFDATNLPKREIELPFRITAVIEAQKVRESQEALKPTPLALASDTTRISIEKRFLKAQFAPNRHEPSILRPIDFPKDAYNLFIFAQTGLGGTLDGLEGKPFAVSEGILYAGPNREYTVGYWTAQMCHTPSSFLHEVNSGIHTLQQTCMTDLCALNPNLMIFIRNSLSNRRNLNGKGINYSNLIETLKFFDYALGIIDFVEKPKPWTKLWIQIHGGSEIRLPMIEYRENNRKTVKETMIKVIDELKKTPRQWTFNPQKLTFVAKK